MTTFVCFLFDLTDHFRYKTWMNDLDYSPNAVAWVNLLVPGKFQEAEKLISELCTYAYRSEVLRGPSIINAFIESHKKASRDLDSIEYLPGAIVDFGPEGALIAVADKISLNGKTHVYNDRLLVRMEMTGTEWKVVELHHLPIKEERDKLKDFLEST
jgi:hypothetical protein